MTARCTCGRFVPTGTTYRVGGRGLCLECQLDHYVSTHRQLLWRHRDDSARLLDAERARLLRAEADRLRAERDRLLAEIDVLRAELPPERPDLHLIK